MFIWESRMPTRRNACGRRRGLCPKNPMMLCVLLELTCTFHVDLILHGNSTFFVPPIYHFNVPKLHSCILDRTLAIGRTPVVPIIDQNHSGWKSLIKCLTLQYCERSELRLQLWNALGKECVRERVRSETRALRNVRSKTRALGNACAHKRVRS